MKRNTARYFFWGAFILVLVLSPLPWTWRHFKVVRPAAIATVTTPTPDFPLATPVPSLSPTPLPLPTTVTSVVSQRSKVKAHILMYHYIRGDVDRKKDPLGYNLSVRPEEFEQQISFLQQHGYHPIHMADLAAGKGDDHSVVLTFDDGYEDFYTTAYPILKKHGWTATLYIITNKIDGNYMSWDQIRELRDNGFEIGDHTVDHEELNKLSPDQQHYQIFTSKATLEQELGQPVTAFCYPVGRYNDTTLQLVKEAGFTTATTTQPGLAEVGNDPLTYKRVRMNPDMPQTELEKLFP